MLKLIRVYSMQTYSLMRNRQPIYILIWTCLLSFSALGQDTLSLDECIQRAVVNNPTVNISRVGTKKADRNLTGARNMNLPTIQGNLRNAYNWGLFIDPSTNLLTTQNNEIYTGGVEGEINLFNGGHNYHNIAEKRKMKKAAEAGMGKSINDIKISVITAYYQIFLSREAINLSETQIDIAKNQHHQVEGLVEAGALPHREASQAKANVSMRELELLEAKNSMKKARLQLKQLTGIDDDFALHKFDELQPSYTATPYESVKSTALASFPELAQLRYQSQAYESRIHKLRGLRYPQLSLIGGVETRSSSLQPVEQRQQLSNNLSQYVGVRISVTLLDRFQLNNQIALSKLEIEENRSRIDQQKNELETRVQEAYLDMKEANKRYETLTEREKALADQFEYAQKSYLAGAMKLVDYNYIYSQYTSVQIERLHAKYDRHMKIELYEFYNDVANFEIY